MQIRSAQTRSAGLLAAAALLVAPLPGQALGSERAPRAPHAAAGSPAPATCSPGDRPETGLQGEVPLGDQLTGRSQQGYTCNLRRVGSTDIHGLGGDTQMTWYHSCAYRTVPGQNGHSDGVAVLDVRNPRHPRVVRILHQANWDGRGGPVLSIHEGLQANARRGILVVPIGTMISVYDIRHDCRAPKHRSDYDFGLPPDPVKRNSMTDFGIHSGKISPDGTLYYATDIGNGAFSFTGPCLTVIDLRNIRHPHLVMHWSPSFPCHDLSLRPDGKRAYVGWYAPVAGQSIAVVGAFTPVVQPVHATSGLIVVDTSQVQRHVAHPQMRILGRLTGGRQHTETFARIHGRSYVIAGEEAYCPGGNGRIVDVTDDHHPVEVAELPLQINQPVGCAANKADTDPGGNILLYMSHYISVDNESDAHLAFFSWYSSGLRVFDISDPRHPREVAYYNPPVGAGAKVSHDSTTTYPRYLPRTGQVWFGSAVNAFTVAELAPRLRPLTAVRSVSRHWSVGAFPRRRCGPPSAYSGCPPGRPAADWRGSVPAGPDSCATRIDYRGRSVGRIGAGSTVAPVR